MTQFSVCARDPAEAAYVNAKFPDQFSYIVLEVEDHEVSPLKWRRRFEILLSDCNEQDGRMIPVLAR
jgi:hypothetical protein